MVAERASADADAALSVTSSRDQDRSSRADRTMSGSCVISQIWARARRCLLGSGSEAISSTKLSVIGQVDRTARAASNAFSSGLTSQAVAGSYRPGKGTSS
ncbi:MAG TPA: hypothetical protein VEC76_19280 [Streptosporangiaceae bacterium]|nr:hypothetical protein [Streptosporangiaceae bacterium]